MLIDINRLAQTGVKFFIGSSPSMAGRIVSPDYPAAGVMVSANALRKRISDFDAGDWILDSGAFTEISRHGYYRYSVEEYANQIERWSICGNLLIAVAQDWMCEPFVLERTGLTVVDHQRLTIERYDQLLSFDLSVPIMPVLQGYRINEYLSHLQQYGSRLLRGAWVGVGSVCRRNGNSEEIADLLKAIKLIRPDLRLHGFGLKQLALESPEVRDCLYSCDSMAWSYPKRFADVGDSVQSVAQRDTRDIALAHDYQQRIQGALQQSVQNRSGRIPHTSFEPLEITEEFIQDFWRLVDKSNSCWVWTGRKDQGGYGVLMIKDKGKIKQLKANRLAYFLSHDTDPGELLVCHECDNPSCVNPSHLWLGTPFDNNRDKILKGRAKTPRTAGAGNGQGRKPKWNRPTTAIRVPAEFADKLIQIAREWDAEPEKE